MKKIKATKVIKKLEEVTFEGVKKKNLFEPEIVLGSVFDEEIGILITANKDASKIILQVGKKKLLLTPETLDFLTKGLVTLCAMLAAESKNKFREQLILSHDNKDQENKRVVFCNITGKAKSSEEILETSKLIIEQTNILFKKNLKKKDVSLDKDEVTEKEPEDLFKQFLKENSLEGSQDEDVEEDVEEMTEDLTEASQAEVKEEPGLWEEDFLETFSEPIEEEEEAINSNYDKYEIEAEEIDAIEQDMIEEPILLSEEEDAPENTAFDSEEQEDDESDGFLKRMEDLENMLTGNFEKLEDEIPTFEKIELIRREHGELAAKEYVSSLSQEQREHLMQERLKLRQAAIEAKQ